MMTIMMMSLLTGVRGNGNAASRRLLAFTSMVPRRSFAAMRPQSSRGLCATIAPQSDFTLPSDFTLVRDEEIKEYSAKARLYEHKTGAEILSIDAPDSNKVFGITFRTPPRDSTGLPHILEHSVLCGSEKFPTKEPFVELLKGSLQTFLNAFTYPDRTCYPVASQNGEDLKNLARVYLDAVFFPRARDDPLVLKQEGWHYETSDEGELSLKGVVYNEMKGVYSSPESLMQRAAQQALFPDNAYRFDSGGDPDLIPDLTFEDFRSFHDDYYHPSNARIFFYGDFPEEERIELLKEYLDRFEPIETKTAVARQPLNQAPKNIRLEFPGEGKHMVSVNFLLAEEPLNPRDELGLAVLDHLLTGTSTSLLRKTLTDSGLGESFFGGLSDELIQPTYTIGMKGVEAADVPKVEALILETLKNAEFSEEEVAASMNTIEFDLREFNTGSFPKGLSFMLGSMRKWIYDNDPIEPLRFEGPLKDLKSSLNFKELLGLFGEHRVTVEMVPSADLDTGSAEKERLAAVDEDVQKIKDEMEELKRIQNAPDSVEALATIPTLSVDDLERKIKSIPATVAQHDKVKVLSRNLPTAGIAYLDVALDLRVLPLSEVPLVSLFARCLMETGTGEMDAGQLQRKINTLTGGIDAGLINTMTRDDELVYRLVLRGKSTLDKTGDLQDLMTTILQKADFSQHQRISEILKETKARYESAFRTSGNSFAGTRLSARQNLAGYVSEISGGVSHYQTVLELLESDDMAAIQARLESMRDLLLSSADPVVNWTCDSDVDVDAICSILEPSTPRQEWSASLPAIDEGFSVPTQVNYVAMGGKFEGGSVVGSDSVVRRVISLDYLWNTVRVQGGAYGGGCSINPITGTFAFSSYRDPNLKDTLDVYEKTTEYLDTLELSQAELDKAIIASVGELDSPMTPDQQGYVSLRHHLDGTTDELRQKWRDEVIGTTVDDFGKFNAKLKEMKDKSAVVFASPEALKEVPDFKVTTLL